MPDSILAETNGKPPSMFEVFKNVLDVLGQPARPVKDPDFTGIKMPIVDEFVTRFALPSLEELGLILFVM